VATRGMGRATSASGGGDRVRRQEVGAERHRLQEAETRHDDRRQRWTAVTGGTPLPVMANPSHEVL
jgi:hypothetical protein